MIKVLLVEDEQDLGNLLKQYLEINQFQVCHVFDGVQAREELKKNQYDLLIIDVMMPNEDGFTLAKKMKTIDPNLPFLFLTARKMKEDILTGLKLGADDYITKPFDAEELILRIQNILKRSSHNNSVKNTIYSFGTFQFEPADLSLKTNKTERVLTEKESELLEYLIQNKDQIIRREDVLNSIWRETDFFSGRSLDVFISRLRKYLSEDPSVQIESLRGIGFRIYLRKH